MDTFLHGYMEGLVGYIEGTIQGLSIPANCQQMIRLHIQASRRHSSSWSLDMQTLETQLTENAIYSFSSGGHLRHSSQHFQVLNLPFPTLFMLCFQRGVHFSCFFQSILLHWWQGGWKKRTKRSKIIWGAEAEVWKMEEQEEENNISLSHRVKQGKGDTVIDCDRNS